MREDPRVQAGWAGMDFIGVVTFMLRLEGFQAEGTACSEVLRGRGLGGAPREKQGYTSSLGCPTAHA